MTTLTHTPKSVTIHGSTFEPYIPAERIHERILELADRISREYDGRTPVLVCVLNGAFLFHADLVRALRIPCEVDFIRTASYGAGMESSGSVQLRKDVESDLRDRHVILVEDIVDTGHSLAFLLAHVGARQPASLSVATLLHKPDKTIVTHELDYVGFEIPPAFVVGYGLDYAQQGRNLHGIYILADGRGDGRTKETE